MPGAATTIPIALPPYQRKTQVAIGEQPPDSFPHLRPRRGRPHLPRPRVSGLSARVASQGLVREPKRLRPGPLPCHKSLSLPRKAPRSASRAAPPHTPSGPLPTPRSATTAPSTPDHRQATPLRFGLIIFTGTRNGEREKTHVVLRDRDSHGSYKVRGEGARVSRTGSGCRPETQRRRGDVVCRVGAAQPSPSAFPEVPGHLFWGLTRCTFASRSQLCVQGGRVRGFLCVSCLFLRRSEIPQLLARSVPAS